MHLLGNPRLRRSLMVLFWLALAFAVVMAVLPKPPHTPLYRFGDKVAHIIAFATLAGLGTLAYGSALRWRVAERLCFLGAAIEVVQSMPAIHRDCDVRDWIADMVAVVVATLAAGWFARRGETAAAARG